MIVFTPLFYCGAGNQIQGLVYARDALKLSPTPALPLLEMSLGQACLVWPSPPCQVAAPNPDPNLFCCSLKQFPVCLQRAEAAALREESRKDAGVETEVSLSIKTKPALKFGGVFYLNSCHRWKHFPIKSLHFFPQSLKPPTSWRLLSETGRTPPGVIGVYSCTSHPFSSLSTNGKRMCLNVLLRAAPYNTPCTFSGTHFSLGEGARWYLLSAMSSVMLTAFVCWPGRPRSDTLHEKAGFQQAPLICRLSNCPKMYVDAGLNPD